MRSQARFHSRAQVPATAVKGETLRPPDSLFMATLSAKLDGEVQAYGRWRGGASDTPPLIQEDDREGGQPTRLKTATDPESEEIMAEHKTQAAAMTKAGATPADFVRTVINAASAAVRLILSCRKCTDLPLSTLGKAGCSLRGRQGRYGLNPCKNAENGFVWFRESAVARKMPEWAVSISRRTRRAPFGIDRWIFVSQTNSLQ